jgi:hypothetical protein
MAPSRASACGARARRRVAAAGPGSLFTAPRPGQQRRHQRRAVGDCGASRNRPPLDQAAVGEVVDSRPWQAAMTDVALMASAIEGLVASPPSARRGS